MLVCICTYVCVWMYSVNTLFFVSVSKIDILSETIIYCWSLVSARVDFDHPASIYFIFSNYPRSRNITAPHQIIVGILLILKINGI